MPFVSRVKDGRLAQVCIMFGVTRSKVRNTMLPCMNPIVISGFGALILCLVSSVAVGSDPPLRVWIFRPVILVQ